MSKEISFENVNYQYPKGSKPSLTDINVSVDKSKLIAVMGKTGSGKTTLLSTTNGLIPQFFEGNFSGKISLNGNNTEDLPIQKLVNKVGLVLQDPETQIFGMTVTKDIAFGPSNLAFPVGKINTNVNNAARVVNLETQLDKQPDQLSGGEKQRLAIAGILAIESPILVLDEPTSELDPEGAASVTETLKNLRDEENRTIIFSTHNPQSVINTADELWVLDEGKIKFNGSPAEFFSQFELAEKFGIQIPEISIIFKFLRELNLYSKDELPVHLEEAIREIEPLLLKLNSKEKTQNSKQINPRIKNTEVLIQINNLSHQYNNGHVAIKNISTDLRKNEMVAILGKNGAGKTTFVKHMIGLLRPSQGEILIKGKDISELKIGELSRTIGFVFQNPDHQIFSASVYDELAYGLLNMGYDKNDIHNKIQRALELTGLQGKENQHPFSLSKGERQKIAMAAVLAIKPEIIVIDEPTTGLDWKNSIVMMEEIRQLKQRGHTIIMITHNLRLAAEYADRIFIMQNGQIIRDGEAHDVFSDLELLYTSSLNPTHLSLFINRLKQYGVPENIITVQEFMDYIKSLS